MITWSYYDIFATDGNNFNWLEYQFDWIEFVPTLLWPSTFFLTLESRKFQNEGKKESRAKEGWQMVTNGDKIFNFVFCPDGSVRHYCIWNNKNYQHELKRLRNFHNVWNFSVCHPNCQFVTKIDRFINCPNCHLRSKSKAKFKTIFSSEVVEVWTSKFIRNFIRNDSYSDYNNPKWSELKGSVRGLVNPDMIRTHKPRT